MGIKEFMDSLCSEVRRNQIVKYLLFCVSYINLSLNLSGYFIFVRLHKYVVVTVVLSNCSRSSINSSTNTYRNVNRVNFYGRGVTQRSHNQRKFPQIYAVSIMVVLVIMRILCIPFKSLLLSHSQLPNPYRNKDMEISCVSTGVTLDFQNKPGPVDASISVRAFLVVMQERCLL